MNWSTDFRRPPEVSTNRAPKTESHEVVFNNTNSIPVDMDKLEEKVIEFPKDKSTESEVNFRNESTETKIDLRNHTSHSIPIDLDDLNSIQKINLNDTVYLKNETVVEGPFEIKSHLDSH